MWPTKDTNERESFPSTPPYRSESRDYGFGCLTIWTPHQFLLLDTTPISLKFFYRSRRLLRECELLYNTMGMASKNIGTR